MTEAGIRLELAALATDAERLAAHVEVVAQYLDPADGARLRRTAADLTKAVGDEVARLQRRRRQAPAPG